ncbi:MAG TPA: TIGR03013 family XrtA/PEP-CTERM system glycosyltransferase [Candidatus Acidoferrales bacterium]|nr:TIGR03013 family XrtA/PEP-CTERM system glycosyltransferase [Candidatus Acidoferrales bacterium]
MIKIGGQRIPTWTLLLLAFDSASIVLGLLIGTAIRLLSWHATLGYLRQHNTLLRFGLVVLAAELSLYYSDLYSPHVVSRRNELAVRVFHALGVACVALGIVYYFAPDISLGRGIAVLAAPAILCLTLSGRLISTHLMLRGPERVLVVGTAPAGISLVREIISRPELNLKVIGFLDEKGENIGKSLVNPGIIGAASDLQQIVARERADRVVLALKERRGLTPLKELLRLKFDGITVEDAHTINEKIMGRIFLEHLSPSWLILSDGFRKPRLLLFAKRAIDFLVSTIALILCLPIMIVVAIAIWLETGTPILFRQERTGLGGRPFEILKFRSMRQDAEEAGPAWAATGDQRVTRVGRIIRKFRLDELPQFINVFRGEMSLVGPRPERPYFCKQIEQVTPYFILRHSVRPGITGWAQISYQYGGTIEESKTKLEYDLFYIKHLSFVLDLAILFGTAKVILSGHGAK